MMSPRVVLIALTVVCLGISTGCQQATKDSDGSADSVEQPGQAPSEADQSNLQDGSSATTEPDQAKSGQEASKLKVDLGESGVDVKVGDAVDVTVGKEGVDVNVQPGQGNAADSEERKPNE